MNYKFIYQCLIERGHNRTLSGYKERHHIVPKCMGGTDCPSNLVDLTPEEHYVAHQLLLKIYPRERGLVFAVLRMSGNRQVSNNKLYGWLRRKVITELSKPKTEEHKRKIGAANRGRKQTPEHIAKRAESIRNTMGSKKTPEEVDAYWKQYWKDVQKAKDSAIITALLYSL